MVVGAFFVLCGGQFDHPHPWTITSGSVECLEEEMATHCSILAWRIPWTEEPGRLQSVGSQRVGHD